ncbi:glycosyltransferase family 4 protein [Dialister hominis]|jgi:glycosyltransferase involved in cell wall biosynthesis|uniref:glycosyltransferase family 4 protein n=1 Tax=Dialister hominis TaxID=2582419 RepID=UPI0024C97D09|nr:glycosyltransferase family 4 protein [uncultured Dialister sp.]UYJ17776.1 MAG: glycosyltransferase family 4 protein [Veillonellaceae bacterium]HJI42026.1 glycosyltransferase family 4 protein [Veillonellaceae bacterium]
MKIAIVCDWLVTYAGAEKVLEQMLNVFPEADLFAVVDFLPEGQRDFIKNKKVTTTFIQNLPRARKKYRNYLPFMPIAIEQLDLSGYDVVISSSHCVAKGVLTGPDQIHISYVHSPVRYAWDLQHQYLREAGLTHGLKSKIARLIMHYMRIWDTRTSNGVDYFIANSHFIARRIWKCYRREAEVIYPPVDVDKFTFCDKKEDFYLTASRMVPYKKMDLIVEAFSKMPDKQLIVIGQGPDFNKIKKLAGPNVKLMGYQPDSVLQDYMQRAKAFIFAAEEDFGITPVEAQACGTPVIAYGKGGSLETVRGYGEMEKPTGIFFSNQKVQDLVDAVSSFEEISQDITAKDCRENAEKFAISVFRKRFSDFVNDVVLIEKKNNG